MHRRPTKKSSSGFPRAGSDRLRRSPRSWRSSPPTRPAMSRVPPTPSTVDGPRVRDRHCGAHARRANPESGSYEREIPGSRYARPGMTPVNWLQCQHDQQGLLIMPVTLDPDAAAVFKAFQEAGRPPYETVSPAEARELYLKARFVSNPEPPELKSVQPLAIPAPHGSIPARVYTPIKLREANGLAPCLVFFHGGGFVIGNLDSHDVVCRKLADEGQLIVIAVDYRLAPH